MKQFFKNIDWLELFLKLAFILFCVSVGKALGDCLQNLWYMEDAIEFLRSKGMLDSECTKFQITGAFGTVDLVELLVEFKEKWNYHKKN